MLILDYKFLGDEQLLENAFLCILLLTLNLYYSSKLAYLVAQMVKNLPAVQETRVQSLGWEDPLENGMATHSSILT